MSKQHFCKRKDGSEANYARPDKIEIVDTHDGKVYWLWSYDFGTEEFEDGRPIGWCPWCGLNLDKELGIGK